MSDHFGRWLREQIAEQGVPIRAFAMRVGVSVATLHSWLNNDRPEIYDFNRARLAQALGRTKQDIDHRLSSAAQGAFDANVEPYSKEDVPEIPMFEWPLAAGKWVEVGGVGEVFDPRQIDHGLFRVRLRGDSMSPQYPDNTIVEFRCIRDGRDILESGKDYYFQQNDGTATFKRLAKILEDELELRALNRKKFPKPMVVSRELVVRAAIAVGKFIPVPEV